MKSVAVTYPGRRATPRPVSRIRARSSTKRIPAFDHLRVFVIALVILQHTAMAYCTGGRAASGGDYTSGSAPVVDAGHSAVANILVSWTDGFFMPLMFLLSGLFVRASLRRKGLGPYLADRALRLGVPLLVGVATIVPLSYYAAFLQSGGQPGFAAFWQHMVTAGPWPSGPFWFVGALLAFDAALALLLSIDAADRFVERLGRTLDRTRPALWFTAFIALSAAFYLPLDEAFGSSKWLTAGPFGIQVSRAGLYFFSFAAGALVGAGRLARAFDRHWLRWPLLAALATVPFFALDGRHVPEVADGVVLVLFSTSMTLGLLALALKFADRSNELFDSFAANAYGIYLLHWPIVLWLQYALLERHIDPIAKGALVLVESFLLAWLASAALRRLPGVARVV